MKTNYDAPQVEVIEIELEGVLCVSGDTIDAPNAGDGGRAW